MKLSIFFRSVKTHLRSSIAVGLGLVLMSLMFAGLYTDMVKDLSALTNSIPKGFEAVIGDMAIASSPEGWLSIELFALFLPLSLSILGIIYGANLIGREEESGSLELLLASSVSRSKIWLQKVLALAKLIAIPASLLFLGIVLGKYWFDFDVNLAHVAAACLAGWLLGMVFGAITFSTQAISGRRGLALAVGSGVMAATYLANVIAKLVKDYKNLEYISPFYYYNNPGVLVNGPKWSDMLILFCLALAFVLISILVFKRRDTGV